MTIAKTLSMSQATRAVQLLRRLLPHETLFSNPRASSRMLKWYHLPPALAKSVSKQLTTVGIDHKIEDVTPPWDKQKRYSVTSLYLYVPKEFHLRNVKIPKSAKKKVREDKMLFIEIPTSRLHVLLARHKVRHKNELVQALRRYAA